MLNTATPSLSGLEFIKRYQGLSLEQYQDEEGLWVVGYGHLIRGHERFETAITLCQAEMLFQQDVADYQHLLHQCLRVPVSQRQFDALLSLAFSLGPEALQQSPILHSINQGLFADAIAGWQQEGKRQSSLATERQAEAELFQADIT
ncbi:lysozyme [Kluyvera ascorbata]|uniref:lysozyme n=1 Tax=Kluyvera ascorbata TaxID=51288 RepID=UPI00374D433C